MKNKLKFSIFLFSFLIIISIGSCFFYKINLEEDVDWFYDFFDRLRKKPIQNASIYSVWVQGDNDFSKLRPIGGSESFYQEWKKAYTALLKAQKKYQVNKDPDFKTYLIIDQRTFDLHKSDLIDLKEKYSASFDYFFIEDLYQDFDNKIIFDQCMNGIGSICSDMIRSTKKNNDDLTIYIDIDLFTNSFQHRKRLISSTIYGLDVDYPGIYHKVSRRGYILKWNCDLLITYLNSTDAHISRVLLRKKMEEYAYRYNDFSQRKDRAKFEKFDDYLSSLNERVDLIFLHGDHYIDQNKIILDVIGPGFWRDIYVKGVAKAYYDADSNPEKTHLSWIDNHSNEIFFKGRYTTNQLKSLHVDEYIKKYIKYSLMYYDASFFKKGAVKWLDLLEQEMSKTDLELNEYKIK